MKLPFAISAAVLALASSSAAAHPHDVPAPPAPPAPPGLPSHPTPAAPAAPQLPALPPMPAMPPPPPPPATLEIPDDVLAACEGKADRSHVAMTASNGARITGTCRKRGNVYVFMLETYQLHTTRRSR